MKPLQALFRHMGVYFLDHRTYYRLLRTTIYPVIWSQSCRKMGSWGP